MVQRWAVSGLIVLPPSFVLNGAVATVQYPPAVFSLVVIVPLPFVARAVLIRIRASIPPVNLPCGGDAVETEQSPAALPVTDPPFPFVLLGAASAVRSRVAIHFSVNMGSDVDATREIRITRPLLSISRRPLASRMASIERTLVSPGEDVFGTAILCIAGQCPLTSHGIKTSVATAQLAVVVVVHDMPSVVVRPSDSIMIIIGCATVCRSTEPRRRHPASETFASTAESRSAAGSPAWRRIRRAAWRRAPPAPPGSPGPRLACAPPRNRRGSGR